MPNWWDMSARDRARRRAGMVRAIRGGRTVAQVAARYGVTVRTVYLACRAAGLKFGQAGNSGARAAAARRYRAIARAARSTTRAQLANRFGVSTTTVDRAYARFGVRPRRAVSPFYARVMRERMRLRPRAGKLVARFTAPRSREAARLLLTTDLAFGAIGRRCAVKPPHVQYVWNRLLSERKRSAPNRRTGRIPRFPRRPSSP